MEWDCTTFWFQVKKYKDDCLRKAAKVKTNTPENRSVCQLRQLHINKNVWPGVNKQFNYLPFKLGYDVALKRQSREICFLHFHFIWFPFSCAVVFSKTAQFLRDIWMYKNNLELSLTRQIQRNPPSSLYFLLLNVHPSFSLIGLNHCAYRLS